MSLDARSHADLGKWIRNDLGVRTFQGLGRNSPSREQVVRRITRDLHTHLLIEALGGCELSSKATLHHRCLLGCGYNTSAARELETCFMYRIHPLGVSHSHVYPGSRASLLPAGGGPPPPTFPKFGTSVRSTETLPSMQRFIEKEREDGMTELEAR